jgi:hypothetical protein
MKAMFIVTIIAAVISGLVLLLGISSANGAPQEAAAAAIAAAFTIIPYCIARSIEAIGKHEDEQ